MFPRGMAVILILFWLICKGFQLEEGACFFVMSIDSCVWIVVVVVVTAIKFIFILDVFNRLM